MAKRTKPDNGGPDRNSVNEAAVQAYMGLLRRGKVGPPILLRHSDGTLEPLTEDDAAKVEAFRRSGMARLPAYAIKDTDPEKLERVRREWMEVQMHRS
jgi:hypothetical protein